MACVELLTMYMMGKYGKPGKPQTGYFISVPSLEPRTSHTKQQCDPLGDNNFIGLQTNTYV
jgi:hypothetical protein